MRLQVYKKFTDPISELSGREVQATVLGVFRRQRALSLQGVSQMDSIPPGRLLALVRPAFDLVLRRIRSLKRCVKGSQQKGKRGFLWQSLTSLEMQPGAKLRRISRGHYFAAIRLHAAF